MEVTIASAKQKPTTPYRALESGSPRCVRGYLHAGEAILAFARVQTSGSK